jgi:hypothetical protein
MTKLHNPKHERCTTLVTEASMSITTNQVVAEEIRRLEEERFEVPQPLRSGKLAGASHRRVHNHRSSPHKPSSLAWPKTSGWSSATRVTF